MKRALSILAICALLLVGLSTYALADGGAASLAITAEKVGEQVVATVKLNNYTAGELSAMTVDVNYNSDALTYKSVEGKIPEVEVQVKDNGAGKLLLCWVASELPATDDGVIAILTFDVKEVAEEESIGLSAGFVADGMVKEGSTEAIPEEEQEETFNSAPAELPKEDDIVIYPEGQEPGEEPDPDDPVVPEDPTNPTVITDVADPDNKVSFGVQAVYTPGAKTHVYKVVISWTDTVYEFNADEMWNPTDHTWDIVKENAYWTEKAPMEFVITNHSSKPVTATAKYEAAVSETVFTFGETAETATEETFGVSLDECTEDTPLDGAPQKKIYASFNPGEAIIRDETTLGAIKITIA